MPLTLQQAEQAGAIAAQMKYLQGASSNISDMLSGSASFSQMECVTSVGSFSFNGSLTAAETAVILNAINSVMQEQISGLATQLNAISV
jgi:hypothetical protein